MIGYLKTQAAQGAEAPRSFYGESSESDDDGDTERFRYPGMPKEPRPIKLSDPYPGGRLAGSKAASEALEPVEPLVHDGSTTVLFVKAGSEHRALLYLMQKVNRLFGLDDMLPEVAPEISAYHYLVLASSKDTPMDGDAATNFRSSTLFRLSGLVVRRVKVLARDPMTVGLVDSTVLQRRLPMRKLGEKLGGENSAAGLAAGATWAAAGSSPSTPRTSNSNSRKAMFSVRMGPEASGPTDLELMRQSRRWPSSRRGRRGGPPELIPVAIYSHPRYLDTAGTIIRNFNRTGLIVTTYLYSTIVAAGAVCVIQGWWRSHLIRGLCNFGSMLRMSRAARRIQRAWRAFILRTRLEMLSSVRRLVTTVGGLLLGANLALTAYHCMMLRDRAARPRPAALFPEQRLRFGFDRAGAMMLVEPERALPRPVKDGSWFPGLPPPPVLRSLPDWCGMQLPLSGERAAVSVHGCREVQGLPGVLSLLTRDTVWRDNSGHELSRATLPDTTLPDPGATAATLAGGGTPGDVVLAVITFPSVHEAAVRAAMLAVYTWDPLRRTGVTLVPMHQTAAARGVQTQAAVVQAITTVAASAGHVVSVPPHEAPGGAGAASSPLYGSSSALAWRHAPPGSRERAHTYMMVTPREGSRTPGRDGSPMRGGSPGRLGSPMRGGSPGRLGSPMRTGSPARIGSNSRTGSPLHAVATSRGSSSYSRGGGSPSRVGSTSRGASPGRGLGSAAGSGAVPGTPRLPQLSPQRPTRSSLAHASTAAAAAAGVAGVAGVAGGTGSPLPSPTRRRVTLPLPARQYRPGTVPAPSTSNFMDVDPSATSLEQPGAGGLSPDSPSRPARPRTTPSRMEGDIVGEPSMINMAGHGSPSRSPGGLYDTQPGAPQPGDNVPLSSLARALSPASTHRPPLGAVGSSLPDGDGAELDASAAAAAAAAAAQQGLLAGGETSLVLGGGLLQPLLQGGADPGSAYSRYDMRSETQQQPGGEGGEGGEGGGDVGAFPTGDGGRKTPITPDSTEAGDERAATPTMLEVEEGEEEGLEGEELAQQRRQQQEEEAGLQQEQEQLMQQLEQEQLRQELEGEDVDFFPEGGPPLLLCEEPTELPPPSPPADPYAHMTVMERHQAMGQYADMVLLPVPRLTPAALSAGWAEGESYDGTEQQSGPQSFPQLSAGSLPEPSVFMDPFTDNPELVVAPMPIDLLHPATVLADVADALGNQGRNERNFADNTARIGKLVTAEERFARHRELMSTLMLTQVIGRQTAVGHVHVPNYNPLSSRAMSQIVTEMRRVYRGEAAELVTNMREQHKEAMAAVRGELAAAARLIASTSCMQAAVVDSELARVEEQHGRAVRARATRATMRAMRRERAMQDRAFAAAFGRQVAGAGKQIVRSEIRARDAVLAAAAVSHVTVRRQVNQMTQAHIALAAEEMAEMNRLKASAVRAEGWTAQVASHYHFVNQWQADQVALRRDDNYARMRRVGPAGGMWGSARPREILRAPLPLTNVVSAAVAAARAERDAAAAAVTASVPAWRSLSAGDARPVSYRVASSTPPDYADDGLFASLPPPGGAGRVSFSSAWLPFEGDHGSLAASSPPASALQSRQTPTRRPLPQPLPEGYVPGAAAALPPPLVEDSEALTASTADTGASESVDGEGARGKQGLRPPLAAAASASPGHTRRGSPPRHLVEGPDGQLMDFLPEAYSVQPFGSRQGTGPPRPVGMVVSRY